MYVPFQVNLHEIRLAGSSTIEPRQLTTLTMECLDVCDFCSLVCHLGVMRLDGKQEKSTKSRSSCFLQGADL